eukprot:CAMPEP_0181293416 /NCGR_PEP_ID=MMETSP1101-20121128/3055_1 /TAXON_ID=46948 /ORGANISM="Rhodomonas abbreviata, Strain Caron Lab Isolate" /LENGTH=368 /DNA_ID=CAMNT_0023398005 /DNA_START=180 /DNA_END=1282 /DNA_ORIENTATION=+
MLRQLSLAVLAAVVLLCGGSAPETSEKEDLPGTPDTSFPLPGDTLDNHIHANVHFDARKSSTFTLLRKASQYLKVQYADRSYLKILTAEDRVHCGPFSVLSRFGVIEHSESREFRACDGILGMGYSDMPRSASFFKTLTSLVRPGWAIHQPPDALTLARKQFAFMANAFEGELQLGGFDANAVVGDMFYTPMHNLSGYGIVVSSISYMGNELLDFTEEHRGAGLLAILDSGSSCMMLPNSTYNGTYKRNPYETFIQAAKQDATGSLELMVGLCSDCQSPDPFAPEEGRGECCRRFEMPPKQWLHPGGCVQAFPDMNVIILGDPFFRSFLVLHDLEPPNYRIGIAPINPLYNMGEAPLFPSSPPFPSSS